MTAPRTPRLLRILAVVIAIATLPTVAGCSANPLQGIVRDATGGNVDIGGATVPADFPAAVPLIEGEVVSGVGIGSGEGKVWNVGVRVADATALDAIQQQLEAAGYETQVQGANADGGSVVSTGADYGVLVVIARDGDSFIANYSVTPTQ